MTNQVVCAMSRCFVDGQYEQAVGIALEARRLDKLAETIKSSPNRVKTLTYSLQVCQTLVINREFREEVRCGQYMNAPASAVQHLRPHRVNKFCL